MSNSKNEKGETIENFWRKWWDSRSREISLDYELDRITTFHDEEIEQLSKKKLLDLISPEENDFIFDAGCGTGVNLSRLNSQVKAIIGMDLSEGMIERCKKRIVKEHMPNVSLIVGNISDIGVRSNVFDKTICMSVLHYLNDEECEAALKELVRISKDGAILVLHVKNLSSLYLSTLYVAKKIKSLFAKNVIMEHYRSYGWYKLGLSKLGAQIVDYNSVNRFLIDFLPKSLFCYLQRMEMKYFKDKFLGKYGADLNIKARIRK